MSLVIGLQISWEAQKWYVDEEMKSGIPRPPKRQGSASSSRLRSEIAGLPVRVGMSLCLMMLSMGSR